MTGGFRSEKKSYYSLSQLYVIVSMTDQKALLSKSTARHHCVLHPIMSCSSGRAVSATTSSPRKHCSVLIGPSYIPSKVVLQPRPDLTTIYVSQQTCSECYLYRYPESSAAIRTQRQNNTYGASMMGFISSYCMCKRSGDGVRTELHLIRYNTWYSISGHAHLIH